jgi:hypothetical protein
MQSNILLDFYSYVNHNLSLKSYVLITGTLKELENYCVLCTM